MGSPKPPGTVLGCDFCVVATVRTAGRVTRLGSRRLFLCAIIKKKTNYHNLKPMMHLKVTGFRAKSVYSPQELFGDMHLVSNLQWHEWASS